MLKSNRTLLAAIALLGLLLAAAVATTWVSSAAGTIPGPGEFVCIEKSKSGGCIVGVTYLTGSNNPGNSELTVVLGAVPAQTPSMDGTKILEGIAAFHVDWFEGMLPLSQAGALSTWSGQVLAEIMAGERAATAAGIGLEVLCLEEQGYWTANDVKHSFTLTPIVKSSDGTVVDYSVSGTISSTRSGVCAIFIDRDNFPNVDVQRRADVSNPQAVTGRGGISGQPEAAPVNYYGDAPAVAD